MKLERQLKNSREWMGESSRLIDGINFKTTNRARVSVALLHLCLEHQKGIHTLVDLGVIGSAYALVRPQFEAYVRGVWFNYCATEEQLASFIAGAEPPKMSVLIEAIAKVEGYEDGALGKAKKEIWTTLNDYTHGGIIQVKARNTPDEISLNYNRNHIANILKSAADFSYLAGVAIARIVDNADLANDLLALHIRLYQVE